MKKAYTVVELMVVMVVIMILSVIVLVGMGSARRDEGFRADYLQFYEDLKSLELRANLGQLAPTTGALPTPTSKQTMSIVINDSSGTYTVNGTSTRTLRNGTKITKINTSSGGTVLFSFVPRLANSIYAGPTPQAGRFATLLPNTSLTDTVSIVLTGTSGITKTIIIAGTTYYITSINIQ